MQNSEIEERVRKTFDTVAESYDHPTMSWFDRTAHAIAKLGALGVGQSALDIATGTGKVALLLAAGAPAAEVVGVDLSAGMLQQATRKAQSAGLSNVVFEQQSFESMNFGERFSLVTCSFGLFFVEEMANTLRHFAAQAKPAGRIVISSFEAGSFAPFNESFFRHYQAAGFEVRPPAWLRLSNPEQLTEVFQAAGLSPPSITAHDFSLELSSEEMWWDIVWNAGYRGLLQSMSEEQLTIFKKNHLAEVAALIAQGISRLPVGVIIGVSGKTRI